MIEEIKNLSEPAIAAICIGVYILIAIIFTFVAGLITDDDDFEYLGILWIFVIPLGLLFGVLRLFSTTFKFANNIHRQTKEHLHDQQTDR